MFTVMTWNVENLFRPDDPEGPTRSAYEQKVAGLASMINQQAPDAVALQEVGTPAALDDLIAVLGGTWHRQVSAHPDNRGIRVAWLTTRPLADHAEITDFPAPLRPVQVDDAGTTVARLGRGALAITVTTEGGIPVRLITAHLKSKLLTFPGGRFHTDDEGERARYAAYALARRAGEATALRAALTAALAGEGRHRPIMLTGDLNDTTEAATTQLLQGPPGSEIGTGGFHHDDRGDGMRMWNLAPCMPAGRNYSRNNNGRKELIDHILVSHNLVKPLDAVTAHAVVDEPLTPVNPADPAARRNQPTSDHAPVLARFADL